MKAKERVLNTLNFKPVDHVPVMEIGTWQQTAERWWKEGLPAEIDPNNMFRGSDFFQLDGYFSIDFNALTPYPPYQQEIIEENEETVLFRDSMGRIRRASKVGTVRGQRMSMDTYIDFPVKDRKSFLELKKRYENTFEDRWPNDWDAIRRQIAASDQPVTLLNPMAGTFGFYSMLRNWMGTEGLSYMFYDDYQLVEECLEFLTDYIIQFMERPLQEGQYDLYYVHEDMCYKNGPLMSPDLFRKLILPCYKRFVTFLKANGVSTVLVDTDGNFDQLIPLFLEGGVDGFGPIEVAAGMDPVALRQKYGKLFSMAGGIDKREIAKGKEAIDRQIQQVILPLITDGGFIPTIDHAIPPDVSYHDFMYYLDMKRKALTGRL